MQTVIPRSYIENYSNALNLASDTAKKALVEALAAMDYTQPVDKIRDVVIAIMQVACGASTSVAARLAADFYDGLRVYMVGDAYGAIAESMRNPAATEGAIRAFIQIIVDGGDVDEFVKMCADRLDYENRRAANECIVANAKKDPKKPRWARVPTGDETCEFCIMLASRGFVYGSAELASHSHANCDCRIIPGWGRESKVEGYSADDYFNKYLKSSLNTSIRHSRRIVDDVTHRAMRDVGKGSKFNSVNEMTAYIKAADNIDDLYVRADVVLNDFKKYWNKGNNASESMFNSISRAAKEMRKKLMR